MDCHHYGGILEYDAHNLYGENTINAYFQFEWLCYVILGLSESIATSKALEAFRHRHSFVISRSTFLGSSKHAGHWTGYYCTIRISRTIFLVLGDTHATFEDLYQTISDLLNFQLYSVPFVGADICGFTG